MWQNPIPMESYKKCGGPHGEPTYVAISIIFLFGYEQMLPYSNVEHLSDFCYLTIIYLNYRIAGIIDGI